MSNDIRNMITEMRLNRQAGQISSKDVISILEEIISKEKQSKCVVNVSSDYHNEELYFIKKLNFVGECKENLKKFVTEQYLRDNSSVLFDFIKELLELYKVSNSAMKKDLIEYGMRVPEVLLDHGIVVVESL